MSHSATLGSAQLGWRARLHNVGHLAQLAAPRGGHSATSQDLVPGLHTNASVLALPVPQTASPPSQPATPPSHAADQGRTRTPAQLAGLLGATLSTTAKAFA